MVREALASLLALEEDIEVVAQVGRGDEVVGAARAERPDVALLDIEMPGATGLDAAGLLRAELPATRVVILTTFSRPGYLRRAMEQGASGFLLKDAPASELAARDPARRRRRADRRPRPGRRRARRGRQPADGARARGARRGAPLRHRRRAGRGAAPLARARPATTSRRSWPSSARTAASRRSASPRRRAGCRQARSRFTQAAGGPGPAPFAQPAGADGPRLLTQEAWIKESLDH